MLYDNGQLLRSTRTRRSRPARSCSAASLRETADWIVRDMQCAGGRLLVDARRGLRRPRRQVLRLDAGEVRALAAGRRSTRRSRARFGLDQRAELRGPLAPARVSARGGDRDRARHRHGRSAAAPRRSARANLLAERNAARLAGPRREDAHVVERAGDRRHGGRRARARPSGPGRVARRARSISSASTCGATGACSPSTRTASRASPPISTTTRSCSTALLELLQTRWRSADLDFATALADALLAHFRTASTAASSSRPTITNS